MTYSLQSNYILEDGIIHLCQLLSRILAFKDFEDKKAVPSWLFQTVDLLIGSRGPVETEREPIRKSKSSFALELKLITYYSWNVMGSL